MRSILLSTLLSLSFFASQAQGDKTDSFKDKSVKTINEAALIPFMVAAIKEQQQAIESLKAEISELKKRPTTTE